jgi:hypothetical protein
LLLKEGRRGPSASQFRNRNLGSTTKIISRRLIESHKMEVLALQDKVKRHRKGDRNIYRSPCVKWK